MKKTIPLLAAIALLCACSQTPEQKAQRLIDERLATLADSTLCTYTFTAGSTLDSTYTSLYNSNEYYLLSGKYEEFTIMQLNYLDEARANHQNQEEYLLALEQAEQMADSALVYELQLLELEEAFTPEHNGWVTQRQYTVTCQNGRAGTCVFIFQLDRELSRLTDFLETTEPL